MKFAFFVQLSIIS